MRLNAAEPIEPASRGQPGVAALAAHIAAHPTATEALQLWCTRHWPRPGGVVRAHVLADELVTMGAHGIGRTTGWRYRRVRLLWGEMILSEAENWYLPACLPPTLRDRLRTSNEPFGSLIRTLAPRRVTIGIGTMRSFGHPVGRADPQPGILRIRAVVMTAPHGVIAEVSERYQAALLE